MTSCFRCGKYIEGAPTVWAWGYFHYDCYLQQTKPLQDFIDSIRITLGMKALESKSKRRAR